MRISDWSSDVCSSDLEPRARRAGRRGDHRVDLYPPRRRRGGDHGCRRAARRRGFRHRGGAEPALWQWQRSEEHTSELQSLMRISYAVFCLKKKTLAVHRPNNAQNILNNTFTMNTTLISKHE